MIFLSLFALPCGAQNELMDDIMRYSGADTLRDYLPDNLKDDALLGDAEFFAEGKSGLEGMVKKLMSLLFSDLKNQLRGFASLCAFLVVCALLRLNGELMGGQKVTNYIALVCLSGCCYTFCSSTLNSVKTALEGLNGFMNALLPVMASLYTLSGNAASAVSQNAGIYAALTLLQRVNSVLLTPLFNFCFALAMVCRITSTDLSGVVRFLKNLVTRLCVTIMTLFVTVLFFQNVFCAAADTLAMRGVKYAASLLPIIGSLVGEATRTVAAGISAIKASAGVFAVAVVIYTVFVPISLIICKKTLLMLCGIVGRIIGADREAAFIEEVNGILSILLCVAVSAGIFFILAVTIFIKTAVNL